MNLKPVKVSSWWTPLASATTRAIVVLTMLFIAPGCSGMVPVALRARIT